MHKRTSGVYVLITLVAVTTGLAGCKQGGQIRPQARVQTQYDKIAVRGEDHANGIFDVTIEYGDDGVGWMAYSLVDKPKFVGTHLAMSTDAGRTWQYVSTVNPSRTASLKTAGKAVDGAWRYETPTLVHDPGDAPARRWKLFVQRVFSKPPYKKGSALWGESWIEVRTAPSPDGPWSEPEALFSAHDGKARINLNRLHPDLKGMAFYNELGSLEHNGTLYLSLDASPTASGLGKWNQRKVILLASKDHGRNWDYVGTLTDHADADTLGYLVLTGTSLVRVGNRNYLLATPAGKKGLTLNKGHAGTVVIEFEDIGRAKLRRDGQGRLVIDKRLAPEEKMHSGGLADYDEGNRNGGIVFCQIDLSVKSKQAQFFKAFNTGVGVR